MQVDDLPPSPAAPPSSSTANILLEAKHLKFKNKEEKEKFMSLKDHTFVLTSRYDPILLQEIGMDTELKTISETMGWVHFGTSLKMGASS